MSIPSNVAEGWSRHSTAHYIQHLWTAHGSGGELETQVEIGRRAGLIATPEAEILIADVREVGRMIQGLVRSLKRSGIYHADAESRSRRRVKAHPES